MALRRNDLPPLQNMDSNSRWVLPRVFRSIARAMMQSGMQRIGSHGRLQAMGMCHVRHAPKSDYCHIVIIVIGKNSACKRDS